MSATAKSANGHATGSYTRALAVGDNVLGLFVWGDAQTYAYRPIYLHVNRSANSPNAQLKNLEVVLGADELCASAEADRVSTMVTGT